MFHLSLDSITQVSYNRPWIDASFFANVTDRARPRIHHGCSQSGPGIPYSKKGKIDGDW
jgi:hypothetical protein